MKKKYLNLMAYAMIVSMSAFTLSACDDEEGDDNNGGNEGNGGNETEIVMEDGATLSGAIEKGKTVILSEGLSFKLSGGYAVEEGAMLKIEPGVTITAVDDDEPDYILVKQGGKIDAQGTAEYPIVMTSELQEAGGWGGIHICGKAHTNRGTGTTSEIGNAPYGGDVENDNSGTLRYIRLEYTGFALDEEHESNGVSFYGVGNGTTVEYLQAYKGADDGFEFFGGSVNAKYLVVTDCEDDSFDWTEGWNGKAQFLVATQLGTTGAKDDGDCLIEADNQDTDNYATPIACPTLSNLTLIGNGSTEGKRGIRLREGTHAKIYNTIVTGKPECLTVESKGTEEDLAAEDGESVLMYITLGTDMSSAEGIYTSAMFTATENHNAINEKPAFSNVFVGTITDGFDMSAEDSFFTAAAYRGAVAADNNWTAGWTK